MLGEPVHNYQVLWDFHYWFTSQVDLGEGISPNDLKLYPDLYEEFLAMRPIILELEASFQISGPEFITTGTMTITPDMFSKKDEWSTLSVPGSPSWSSFFNLNSKGLRTLFHSNEFELDPKIYKQSLNRIDKDLLNKNYFMHSDRFEFTQMTIKRIEWSRYDMETLRTKYNRREARAKRNTTKQKVMGVIYEQLQNITGTNYNQRSIERVENENYEEDFFSTPDNELITSNFLTKEDENTYLMKYQQETFSHLQKKARSLNIPVVFYSPESVEKTLQEFVQIRGKVNTGITANAKIIIESTTRYGSTTKTNVYVNSSGAFKRQIKLDYKRNRIKVFINGEQLDYSKEFNVYRGEMIYDCTIVSKIKKICRETGKYDYGL